MASIADWARRIRRSVQPTTTAGHSGTRVFGGFVQERELAADLASPRTLYKTYSDMLSNVSIVSASVRWFLNLISKAEWEVLPAEAEGQEEEAERIADLMRTALGDMATPLHRVVRRAAMYRFYGFSVQEWTAMRMADGLIGFEDIAPRAQITCEKWDCDEHGRIRGVIQRSPHDGRDIYLPREKIVYLVDDSLNDSPTGLGLFRHVVEASRRLQRYEQLEGWGFETDLRGIPVGRAPYALLDTMVTAGDISEEQRAALLNPMETFVQKHVRSPQLGLLIDSMTYTTEDDAQRPSAVKQFDLELLKAGSTSLPDMWKTIDRLNKEIARTLGTESLMIGGDGVGSLALARDKSENFALIVDSTLQEIHESFEDDVVKRLMELNGWPLELTPTLRTSKIQHRDVMEITGALEQMARAGAVLPPDDPAVNAVRGLLGLPPQDTDLLEDLGEVVEEDVEEFPDDTQRAAVDNRQSKEK